LRPCSEDIRRAFAIMERLSQSLDLSFDSDVQGGLEGIFAYLRTRLMEANSQRSLRVLQEIETLLITVHQSWQDNSTALT
jgi:flagellar protein FliS